MKIALGMQDQGFVYYLSSKIMRDYCIPMGRFI